MKRTKDGGAILYQDDGEVKLTKKEFVQSRLIRDLGRVGIIMLAMIFDIIFKTSGMLTIGIMLVMIAWRLKVGW
jgi:hypothetical protein